MSRSIQPMLLPMVFLFYPMSWRIILYFVKSSWRKWLKEEGRWEEESVLVFICGWVTRSQTFEILISFCSIAVFHLLVIARLFQNMKMQPSFCLLTLVLQYSLSRTHLPIIERGVHLLFLLHLSLESFPILWVVIRTVIYLLAFSNFGFFKILLILHSWLLKYKWYALWSTTLLVFFIVF